MEVTENINYYYLTLERQRRQHIIVFDEDIPDLVHEIRAIEYRTQSKQYPDNVLCLLIFIFSKDIVHTARGIDDAHV